MTEPTFTRSGAVAPVWLPVGAASAVLVLDQLAKWLATRSLGPGEPDHRIELISAALALHYVQNTGAAFGMFRGQTPLLTAVAVAMIGGLIVSYARAKEPTVPLTLGLGLLIGGALGNLVDRYRLGYVVDFVSVSIWPKFNLADAAITIGVVLVGFHLLRLEPASDISPERTDDADRRPVALDAER